MDYRAPLLLTPAAALAIAAWPAEAQSIDGGARAVGLAGAGVATATEDWGEANPASWATTEARTAGLFASQAFGLPELRTVAARAVLPTRFATLAAAARSYGFTEYRELRASLGSARTVPVAAGRRVALGVRADYHAIAIAGYATRSAIDFAVGLQADVTPAVSGGVVVRNALSVARSDSADLRTPSTLSPVLAVGATLRPGGATTLAIDVEKDLDFPPVVRVGVEFRPVRPATLRLGSALPLTGGIGARMAFGAGVDAGGLTLDVAIDWHTWLGPSPAVGITARF